jgi:hypothetical protein
MKFVLGALLCAVVFVWGLQGAACAQQNDCRQNCRAQYRQALKDWRETETTTTKAQYNAALQRLHESLEACNARCGGRRR